MYYKKHFHKPTENDLTPKAYSLLGKLFDTIFDAGLSVGEIRLVLLLLRDKIEDTIKGCAFGGTEE